MSRRLRVHMPGGFHHVTLRGNHQQPIFFADADRDLLDDLVAEAVERFGLRIHAFCWMTNHLHLLAQVSDQPLGRAIALIASRYARSMQRSLETSGHFFERRYHAKFVDADRYFLTLLRYIHCNPVEAGIAPDPAAYRWSSHANYLGTGGPGWVTTGFGLGLLGASRTDAAAAYCRLIGSKAPDDDARITDPRDDGILGDEEFRMRVLTWRRPAPSVITLDDLVRKHCTLSGVEESTLAGPSRSRELAGIRASIAREAVAQGAASLCAVARRLGRTEGALRQAVQLAVNGKRGRQ